ncbi:GH92 family glycosyl hydrolase [Vitiosangium sp. GDMCC 1.1324]|uniref:GH92 family glycosyl hydrolase n=1 Tax=Vitiosangium sp. (strain GDMCC 1.1324) TaxID=2138576 RepID=UPI000D343D06|nr:GH92 family glycosyl hydrolase [Vitiosangium sp. GDMCC 1.1324]PTL85713.1 sugar hydrolase [Vitiosangium sp. GDMCC 1.1324]
MWKDRHPRLSGACRRGVFVFIAILGSLTAASARARASDKACDSVDPFIGTGGDGHTFPGAVVPFGMIQLSPDTQIRHFRESYKWASGYRYDDGTIQGFSHTHFSGTGHSDLGDVLVMPLAGEVRLEPGDPDKPGSGYRSRFSHDDEKAEPGYYAVTLSDPGIRAELTANRRVGLHRYRFSKGTPAHLLIDQRSSIYNHPGKVLWSRLRVLKDGTVTGFREVRGWAPGRPLFFAMRFSQPLTGHALHNREEKIEYKGFSTPGRGTAERAQLEGRELVGVFDFGDLKDRELLVKVAISPVSEENALSNLEGDMPGWDFDATRAAAREEWRKALSVVDIDAPAPMRKMLYTALYHAMIAPSLFTDIDGRYRGPDNQVHQAEGFSFYSTFSLWDTYRAEHPLLTLLQPEQRNNDFIHSLIASQRVSPYGVLPVWQFHGLETWCMIGYHAVPVIADAYMKGIRGYPADQALEAMVASATYKPYGGLEHYMALGYVPIDQEPEAASKTLEYAYDDWTIARMARALGREELAARFEKRAQNYRNVFDTRTGFVRARKSDGSYREPFDPAAVGYGSDYTEGNAWQYSWYMPQDTAGLISLLGGDAKLVAKLDSVFDARVSAESFAHVEDISGLIGHYAHGNEPSHHVAYLYNYAGQPWRTQERLKQIVDSQYKAATDGLAGNDDCGQMSAWLVFTALGFYPVTPGSNEYVIGRPFVERATLELPNGKRFTIVAEKLGDAHPYIGKVTLNGKPLERSYVRHEELLAGGELRFVMQARPDKTWATKPGSRPYSMSPYSR